MPKLLSGGILRSGGSGEFIALPGAQPALLPTPTTTTGYTLILDAQQRLSYASSLGNISFNNGVISAVLPDGNLSFESTGTGTLQFNSNAVFNKQVTFANTFSFVDILATGVIRFTTTTDSSIWNDGAVVINGSLGVGKTVNLNGPLNVYSSTNFYTDVSISPAGYNVNISPTLSGKVTIRPNTLGNMDNMTIGSITPQDAYFKRITVSSTLTSTSPTTGSVVIIGGVGIGKDVYVGGSVHGATVFDAEKRVVSEVDISLGKGLAFIGTPTVLGPTVNYGLTNTGVTSITAGTGTYIDRSTGDVTIWTSGFTLQEVTNAGNSTTNQVLFFNTSSATSITSASVTIAGGLGIAKNLIVGGSIVSTDINSTGIFNSIRITSSATNTTTFASNALYSSGGIAMATDLMVGQNAYIYGNLTVFGTLTQTVSTIADIGRKIVALSTSAGPAILSAQSGITVGPVASPFIKFLYDGISSWKTTGNIAPDQNNSVTLGTSALQWANVYAIKETISGTATSVSTTTGALVVTGGVGVGGSLYASQLYDTGNRVLTDITTIAGSGLAIENVRVGTSATITFTNTGVTSITAGTGTYIDRSTGDVTIWAPTNDFQGVTNAGHTTTNQINITNLTPATTTTGALRVDGGVSIGNNLYVGDAFSNNSQVVTIASLKNYGVASIRAGTDTAVSTATGDILIWNTSTLQSITNRGSTTTNKINITSTSSSALSVSGGTVLTNLNVNGNSVFLGTSTFVGAVTFTGTATYVYSTNTYYTDNIIDLHIPPTGINSQWAINDGQNIGFNFNYNKNGSYKGFLGFENSTGYLVWVNNTQTGAYGTFKSGSIQLVDDTISNSTTTGALTVLGGAGIGGDLYVGGLIYGAIQRANTVSITTATDDNSYYINFVSTASGYASELVNTDFLYNPTKGIISSPQAYISSGTVSTSTQTGALLVKGGVGVGGDIYATTIFANNSIVVTAETLGNYGVSAIYAGTDTAVSNSTGTVIIWNTGTLQSVTNRGSSTTNAISITNFTDSTSTTTGALTVSGGVGIGGFVNISGNVIINSTENSTGPTNGALVVVGGIGSGIHYATELYDDGNRTVTRVLPNGSTYIGIDNVTSTGTATTFTVKNLGVTNLTGTPYLNISQSTGSVTLTNLGVHRTFSTPFIGVSTSTGSVYITNLGVTTLTGTQYLSISQSTGSITLTNLGVQQNIGSTFIGVSTSTGSVYITNLGVQEVTGTPFIGVSTSTGSVYITNLGVTTLTGTQYLSISQSTGSITLTNLGVQQNIGSTFIGVSTSTGSVYITNLGVHQITTGSGISVSTSTGSVTIASIDSLQLVTNRGATTDNVISITNTTAAISTLTGALTVSGGIGVRGDVFVGGTITAQQLTIEYTTITSVSTVIDDITTIRNTTNSTSTTTGALQVWGGVGIGLDLYVGGDAIITGTIYGNLIGTANNIKGGKAGSIPIQSSTGTTSFIPIGTDGTVLVANNNTATFQPISNLTVDNATNALNVAVTTTNVSQSFYPTFVEPSTSTFRRITIDTDWTYNPVANVMSLLAATSSTNTGTGALVVLGGAGFGGDVNIGQNSTVIGNQQVNGVITVGSGTQITGIESLTFNAGTAGILQIIDTWSISSYRTAKYMIQITDTGFSPIRVHATEISIFHDGSNNIYSTEYGIHTNLGILGTFDAGISASTLELKFRPNGSGLTPNTLKVKLTRTLIAI